MNKFLAYFLLTSCFAYGEFCENQQLLLVLTPSLESCQGRILCYEKQQDDWKTCSETIPVFVGLEGLAWGIGLHEKPEGFSKYEGDHKSPAGIFEVGPAFGFEEESRVDLKIDYLALNSHHEAVDDPESIYYNTIQDNELVDVDWKTSEKMTDHQVYKWGFVIQHNSGTPLPGYGSAVFGHIESGRGTEGCTAMSEEHLLKVLKWLDPTKKPVIVQLCEDDYAELKTEWDLP